MSEREKIEYELRGKTLTIYLYMLKQGKPVGVREVQRDLKLSSPSVAFHHLDKLVRLGVVEQDQLGNYVILKKVDPGILQAFVNVGKFSLPRVGFYAVFFTTIAVTQYVRIRHHIPSKLPCRRHAVDLEYHGLHLARHTFSADYDDAFHSACPVFRVPQPTNSGIVACSPFEMPSRWSVFHSVSARIFRSSQKLRFSTYQTS